jgi:hypothetical protein
VFDRFVRFEIVLLILEYASSYALDVRSRHAAGIIAFATTFTT